jgi:hypothetical protein
MFTLLQVLEVLELLLPVSNSAPKSKYYHAMNLGMMLGIHAISPYNCGYLH